MSAAHRCDDCGHSVFAHVVGSLDSDEPNGVQLLDQTVCLFCGVEECTDPNWDIAGLSAD